MILFRRSGGNLLLPSVAMNLPFVGRHIASLLPPLTVVIRSHLHRGTPDLRSISSSVTSPRRRHPLLRPTSSDHHHRLLPSSLIPRPQLSSEAGFESPHEEISPNTGVEPAEILKSVGKSSLIPENFDPHGTVKKIFDQESQPPPIETPPSPSFDFGEKDLASEESLWSLYERWMDHWIRIGKNRVSRDLDKNGERFDTFKKNAKYVHEFNKKSEKKGESCRLALNMFAAKSHKELTSNYCRRPYRPPRGTCKSADRRHHEGSARVPDRL